MAQYKKTDIKDRIDNAALDIFVEKGYENAAVSDTAKKAGVSVGNVYRYYKSKEEIFYSVVPEDFISEFKDTLMKKVTSAKDIATQGNVNAQRFLLMNEEFIEFIALNRVRMVILFMGSSGTRYEFIKDEIIDYLIKIVRENYSGKENAVIYDGKNDFVVRMVFVKLIEMMMEVLKNFKTVPEIKSSLNIINFYHLFGVTHLFR